MLSALIGWSLENRLIVLVLTGLLILSGLWSLQNLAVDAIPDTSPIQVQVNTVAPSLSPEEMELQVTAQVERALAGIPGLSMMRSLSKFGFSQVILIFEDSTDIYRARQIVSERLLSVEIPDGVDPPTLGPITTGLGEIFHYLLTSKTRDLTELRTLHDWVVKPILASVPGIAEVNSWGGQVKQYHVLVDPAKLVEYGVRLSDLEEALRANNANVGGGALVQAGEQILVHGIGIAESTAEIGQIVIDTREGLPIRVSDVGSVQIGYEIRRGATTAEGQGEALLGLAFMLRGQNAREVTVALEDKLEEVRQAMPADVSLEVVYNRIELVRSVLATVRTNLIEGAGLVVLVLFVLMGSLRAGIITGLSIPLSMLFAFNAMYLFGIEGTLMSLGAIDFGIVVDSSIIIVENTVRRLGLRKDGEEFKDTIRQACLEVRRPTLFGEAIIMIVYLPILTLRGVEGHLFRPMALTFLFCLLGSLILSLTLMPVLASLFLSRKQQSRESWIMRGAQALYRPVLTSSIRHPLIILAASSLILGATVATAMKMGAEFIPRLSEGSIVANTVRLAGVSLDESIRYGTQLEKLLLETFPNEIDHIWTRTGTAEVATDPMGLEVSDVFITLHPRESWTAAKSQDELAGRMSATLSAMPGMRVVFSQPIEMRMTEMVAGTRADIALKIYGDDLAVLEDLGEQAEAILMQIPGATDIRVDQLTGLPVLQARLDHNALARYGARGEDVLAVLESVGGRKVGEIRENDRRFDLVVRLADEYRNSPKALEALVVETAGGATVPFADLARLEYSEGPATIQREWGDRSIAVQCNVRDRDVATFVEDLQARIEADLPLPPQYHTAIGGQFEHLLAARYRLMVVVPLALGLIFVLLYLTYGTLRDALLVSTKVPFAAVGGVFALYWRGMPFTISAAIGFIALFGIAILNGLVVVSTIKRMLAEGLSLTDAVVESSLVRLRPVLATAITDAAGFLPMAISLGVGAEVQRPLATVVIGGILSSTLLTLVVLPVLYSLFGPKHAIREPLDWAG